MFDLGLRLALRSGREALMRLALIAAAVMVGLARERGTTVVLVTHEARVAAYADREVIVRDGRVTSFDAEEVTA